MGRQPARLRAARLQGRRRPPGGRAKRSTERTNRARRSAWRMRRDLRGRVPAMAAMLRRATATARGIPDGICRRRPPAGRCAGRAVLSHPLRHRAAARHMRRATTEKRARRRASAPSGRQRHPAGQSSRGEACESVLAAKGHGYGITVLRASPPSRRGQVSPHVHLCGSAPGPVLSRTKTCL